LCAASTSNCAYVLLLPGKDGVSNLGVNIAACTLLEIAMAVTANKKDKFFFITNSSKEITF
jgi:hypothetical protein